MIIYEEYLSWIQLYSVDIAGLCSERFGLLYCTEHIISIVASLVKNCEGIQRQRLINKFIENDHEKIDRLMELHFKYLDRVNKADDKIEQKKRVGFCLSAVCCKGLYSKVVIFCCITP